MVALLVVGMLIAVAPAAFAQQAEAQSGATATNQQKAKQDSKNPLLGPTSSDEASKKPNLNPAWRVQVTPGPPKLVTLKAQDAPLGAIAAEISRQAKLPIVVSSLMKKQLVTFDFANIPLEGALRLLAPEGYIDYALSGNFSVPSKPLVVYLSAVNEKPSKADVEAIEQTHRESRETKRAQFFVFKGDTEAMTANPALERRQELFQAGDFKKLEEEATIKVTYDPKNKKISVMAKDQPLPAVLYEIAAKVNIPAQIDTLDEDLMKEAGGQLVNVDISDYSVEDAVRSLSPAVILHVRTDLQTSESRPLRVILTRATATAANNSAN